MRYILLKQTEFFVSPHNEVDEGRVIKDVFIEDKNDETYGKNLPLDLDEDGEPWDEENLYGSEDGYNMTFTNYYYSEISKEQYEEYKKVIEKYEEI